MYDQLLITLMAAISGGFLVHILTSQRDRANKRQENRVVYLIEAYRRLESCALPTEAYDKTKLESAVADIQLLGTPRQVELVQRFARDFASHGGASLDSLLQDLRAALREELRLEKVPPGIIHLRITREDHGV